MPGGLARSARRFVTRLLLRWNRIAVELRHGIDFACHFEPEHYGQLYPGLQDSGVDPLDHFAYFGVRDQPNPHPLFDAHYYLSRYPDLHNSGAPPFVHYITRGWRDGRDPHPAFCGAFYLNQVPSLPLGAVSPISHYARSGWKLGHAPHPLFDGCKYLDAAPDVAAAGLNPLIHYLQRGMAERRRIRPRLSTAGEYEDACRAFRELLSRAAPAALASLDGIEPPPGLEDLTCLASAPDFLDTLRPSNAPAVLLPHPSAPVDVIVPCYLGEAETVGCLNSLLKSGLDQPMEIIVVDDASPEPRISEYLRQLAAGGEVTLIRNTRNRGFVRSVNDAIDLHPSRDVALLNSDTVAPPGWLDRLVAVANQYPNAATVTPLSNNATICSYPAFCGNNSMPWGHTVDSLDRLAAEVNRGRSVEVPTAVGFCMLVRRRCIEQVGFFDAETFARGYGEENDFSLRAARLGWSHRLALDVFFHHTGGVSFRGETPQLQALGREAILRRYPEYDSIIAAHVRANPAALHRFALTAAVFRSSGRPVRLILTESAGFSLAVVDPGLDPASAAGPLAIALRPAPDGRFALTVPGHIEKILFNRGPQDEHTLIELLRLFNVTEIQLHGRLTSATSLDSLYARLASYFNSADAGTPADHKTASIGYQGSV